MADQKGAGDGNLKGKKLLIVEDDSLLHNLLAERLSKLRTEGVEVFPTFNADEALRVAQHEHPDLMVIDLILPGKNGLELLEDVRKDEALKHMKTIVFSNLNQEEERTKAEQLGVVGYFIKADSSLDDITKEIRSALAG